MKPYSVIGFYTDNGQIFCFHVEAETSMQAFAVCARHINEDSGASAEFVVCIAGHPSDDGTLEFPGECVVDVETVLEQPDVF